MGKYRTRPKKINECDQSFGSSKLFWLGSILVLLGNQPTSTEAYAVTTGGIATASEIPSLLINDQNGNQYTFEQELEVIDQEQNCTPSGISDFPPDLFTKEQRQNGALIFHIILSIYCFIGVYLVCDDYLVPSIEAITRDLQISTDLAGATFMAISTSAPELFTNIIGTFVTKGDLGVGTIVGSAVFNILAVGSCCGFFAIKMHKKDPRPGIKLEWWPLTRDCLFYVTSVGLLLLVLRNRRIYWYEALTLLLFYLVYVLVMCNNTLFKSWANKLVSKCSKRDRTFHERIRSEVSTFDTNEKSPLLIEKPKIPKYDANLKSDEEAYLQDECTSPITSSSSSDTSSEPEDVRLKIVLLRSESRCIEEKEELGLFTFPKKNSCWNWFCWIVSWPLRFCFTFTIPDCRDDRWKRFYVITLLICICWIGGLTYLVSWMMEVIGETLNIPESVTGLTVLAAGTSLPEVISSVIVARQGFGTMGLSNSIGSNTFDLLFCLGLPWFIESLIMIGTETPYVEIQSGGLEYSVSLLITSVILFYIAISCNGYVLDWRIGLTCFSMYSIFITIACLLELNFFFTVNLPPC